MPAISTQRRACSVAADAQAQARHVHARGVQLNVGRARPSKTSGRPSETWSGKAGARFSKNAATPSAASPETRRAAIARESARCAAIGWGSPPSATAGGATAPRRPGRCCSTISRAIERAARAAPPGCARCGRARRAALRRRRRACRWRPTPSPCRCRRCAGGTSSRPLGHDAAADVDEAELAVGRAQADVHRQRHRCTDADRRAVDRPDHGLERVEDAQRDHAAAVARHAVCRPCGRREAAAAEVRAGAERLARAGHDDRADVVVGVGGVERVQQLLEHPVGQRVELLAG